MQPGYGFAFGVLVFCIVNMISFLGFWRFVKKLDSGEEDG